MKRQWVCEKWVCVVIKQQQHEKRERQKSSFSTEWHERFDSMCVRVYGVISLYSRFGDLSHYIGDVVCKSRMFEMWCADCVNVLLL